MQATMHGRALGLALVLLAAGCETAGMSRTPMAPVTIDPDADESATAEPVATEPLAVKPDGAAPTPAPEGPTPAVAGTPARIPPTGKGAAVWTHKASGVVFPPQVGDFVRGKITRFDPKGLDVGVGYNLLGKSSVFVATVFVFPAPKILSVMASDKALASMRKKLGAGAWKASIKDVVSEHAGATVDADEEVTVVNDGRTFRGRRATFHYDEDFGLGAPLRAESFLYGFHYVGGEWIVEFRFTHPVDLAVDPASDARAIDVLMKGIRWP